MPIYEYRCTDCGHQLEALQKFSEAPLVDCPQCGKPALTKLISASAFQLKGTGWYVTDFRDKDKKKDAGKAEQDTGKAEQGGGKAAEQGGGKAAGEGKADREAPAEKAKTGGESAAPAAKEAPKKTGSET